MKTNTLVNTVRRGGSTTRVVGPALKPWVEYLSRLPEPDRSLMIHDLQRVGVNVA